MTMERVKDSEIPKVKVDRRDRYFEDGRIMPNEGYLTPFRGYKFQVSKTPEGEGDLGGCEVLGLGNIVKAFDNYKRPDSRSTLFASNTELVKGVFMIMAENALYRFRGKGVEFDEYDVFNKFINDSIVYIREFVNRA